MSNLSPSQLKEARELYKKHFWAFAMMLQSRKWFGDVHFQVCDKLQKTTKEPLVTKVIILARNFLKTTIATICYPIWLAINDPNRRILVVSNTQPNAKKILHAIKDIFESNRIFQALFPELIPDFNHTRWSDECAEIEREQKSKEGTFEAAGTGTRITGRHYDVIIEDDTVSPKRDELTGEEIMPTRDDIEKAVGFHKVTVPILVDPRESQRIVVGTRWASYDLINYVLQNENHDALDLPAMDEDGNPLWPERFDKEVLMAIKANVGSYLFSSLYLNKPLAKEFMKFRPDWIKYYEPKDLPADGTVTVTIDPADPPTGKKNQDYSVILPALHTPGKIYVLPYIRKRMTDRETITEGINLALKHNATKIRIETDRYAHLEYGFKDELGKRNIYIVVDAVKTRGRKKEARIMGLQPLFENGNIHLRRNMAELESELYEFPRGAHDDVIDALAWQLPSHRATEADVEVKAKKYGRMLPTFGEMLDTLRHGRRSNHKYPIFNN